MWWGRKQLRGFVCLALGSVFFREARASLILNESLDPLYEKIESIVAQKYSDNETRLCLALPEKTRYFLYRRAISLAVEEKPPVQQAITEKFRIMAYLVCRESSGRVVSEVAHKHERSAARYGTSYADFKSAIAMLLAKRRANGNSEYFNHTTNAGPFQVSADQVDNVSDKYDPYLAIHRYFVSSVKALNSMSESKLLKQCGTLEYFDPSSAEDRGIVGDLKSVLSWMTAYIKAKGKSEEPWFRDANAFDVMAFHQIQTLCPHLNLEIAKQLHFFKGGRYFGPLNNTQNSGSCGKTFTLCGPIFSGLINYLNQANVVTR